MGKAERTEVGVLQVQKRLLQVRFHFAEDFEGFLLRRVRWAEVYGVGARLGFRLVGSVWMCVGWVVCADHDGIELIAVVSLQVGSCLGIS